MKKRDDEIEIIDLTPENISEYGVCGYKDMEKQPGLRRKIEWFNRYYPEGLRIKALILKKGGYQGMIEFLPGEHAHRPVRAEGYMFIHCLYVGFKKEFKGRGYASFLIDKCISDAKSAGMLGVAVVTRGGAFMVKKDIFLKKGFSVVDDADPDFELLVLKFNEKSHNPVFNEMSPGKYSKGLTIFRSPQCPYSAKNVDAIIETAKKMKLKPQLIELEDPVSVQNSPCAFGTFCIIKEGVVVSHHPISNKRFENIIKK
jgi:GNAT superfamily N-acetyltransferase